ncbi:MAG: bifunctional riboflavin kinase/FAD synthetase [Desulfovibrio sp.]|nr:bifunctional riboflavin kinase/FAD synthetase [Desulfovibrio sp.]
MLVARSIDALPRFDATGVTIGNFDGVHRGHRALIHHALDICRERDLKSVLVTFWPHPRLVVGSSRTHCPLSTRERRLELLAELDVDYVLELPFTAELAAQSPKQFVEGALLPLSMRHLVVGYDFSLGKGRSGSFEELCRLGARYGFSVDQLPPIMTDGEIVSSTRIRTLLREGDVSAAARLLGRNYGFSGQVVHGDGRGEILGFPTANLEPQDTLLPAEGVYAARMRVDEHWHKAVTNIGTNPTFRGRHVTIESFLLDTKANLYDRVVRLEFVQRLRGEIRFSSPDSLIAQIRLDVDHARTSLAEEMY